MSKRIKRDWCVDRKQSVVLYILATPFTLIDQLGWWIVPTLVLAAFILFGIDAIGAQIGKIDCWLLDDCDTDTKRMKITHLVITAMISL